MLGAIVITFCWYYGIYRLMGIRKDIPDVIKMLIYMLVYFLGFLLLSEFFEKRNYLYLNKNLFISFFFVLITQPIMFDIVLLRYSDLRDPKSINIENKMINGYKKAISYLPHKRKETLVLHLFMNKIKDYEQDIFDEIFSNVNYKKEKEKKKLMLEDYFYFYFY